MPPRRRFARFGLLLATWLLGAVAPAHAIRTAEWGRDFGTWSLAVSGGVQLWTLTDLESAITARAEELAIDGYQVGKDSFNPAFAYGAELQVRLSEKWFTRLQFDWTRLSLDDRDRQFLQYLGGRQRTPVSLSYETKVQTHPLLAELGLGRSWRNSSLRFGLAGSLVVAPIKVLDEITVYIEQTTTSEVSATGTGVGGELTVSCDYFTDSDMNVFMELFGRMGGTDVELDDGVWESTILPGSRHIGIGGAGLRVGFRWI